MTINSEQIQALKAAAENATPGRIGDRIDGSGSIKYECVGYDGSTVLKTDHKNMEYGFVGDNGDADELFFRLCVPDVILSLLAERDADKALIAESVVLFETLRQRIAELEQKHCGGALMEREEHHVGVVNKLLERIAELEARTVTVKFPALPYLGSTADWYKGFMQERMECSMSA
jgi:hypothetical protein